FRCTLEHGTPALRIDRLWRASSLPSTLPQHPAKRKKEYYCSTNLEFSINFLPKHEGKQIVYLQYPRFPTKWTRARLGSNALHGTPQRCVPQKLPVNTISTKILMELCNIRRTFLSGADKYVRPR
ncbi:unnamed protein product, partial [Ectocarpus fasciculatus]